MQHRSIAVAALALGTASVLIGGSAALAEPADPSIGRVSYESSWDGRASLGSFGVPNTQVYGQVFVAPESQGILSSFDFRVRNSSANPLFWHAELFAWDVDAKHTTGENLWKSDVVTSAAASEWSDFSFTPGAAIVPGDTYVVFGSTIGNNSEDSEDYVGTQWATHTAADPSDDPIPGGRAVWFNTDSSTTNADRQAALGTQAWTSTWPSDFAMTMNFGFAPEVTAVTPASGSTEGGTSVTLTGTHLEAVTSVEFGGVPATSFSVGSDSTITAVSPAHDAGTVDVTVFNGATSTYADGFTFEKPAPEVTTVAPSRGGIEGGTSVTLTGAHLGDVTSVAFGDTPATSFTVDSDSTITAVTPAHDAGTVDVTVANEDTSTTADDAFSFDAPVIVTPEPSPSPTETSTPTSTPSVTPTPVATATSAPAPSLGKARFRVTTDDSIEAGDKLRVKATGLAAGEKYTIRYAGHKVATGTASAKGAVNAVIRTTGANGERHVKVVGSKANRFGVTTTQAYAAKKLSISAKPSPIVQSNRTLTITVKGLASHEPVTVKFRGDVVSGKHAKANAKGVYKVKVSAGYSWGYHTVKVTGATDHRVGSKKVDVERRIN
jgi:hypothetical protein